jgi:FkbM family methyltransferase
VCSGFLLLVAPFCYYLFRMTKWQRWVNWCLACDPRYSYALDQRYVSNSGSGPELLQLSQSFELAAILPPKFAPRIRQMVQFSHSQLLQDILALILLDELQGGYFLEVGVGDGVYLSNTYCLEKKFGWSGLLLEPNRNFHASIAENRTAKLVRKAAFSKDGLNIDFEATAVGEYSRLAVGSYPKSSQAVANVYEVETITLSKVLEDFSAPPIIDYVSIDTEGSEYEILLGLDLNRWMVKIFSIEHNYNRVKSKQIRDLLTRHGYRPVLSDVMKYDVVYVHKTIAAKLDKEWF